MLAMQYRSFDLLALKRYTVTLVGIQYIDLERTNETVENTEEAIKNGRSRETGNIWCTRRRETKQNHKKICFGNHYTPTKIIAKHESCALN
jgi:hypothetical protein